MLKKTGQGIIFFTLLLFFNFIWQGEDCPSTQDWTQCSWRDERQHKIKSHLWCLRMFLQQFELTFVTCILYWLTMSYSLYTGFHFYDFLYAGFEVVCVILIKLLWKNSRCPKQNFSLTQHSHDTNKVCHPHFVIFFYLVNHFACLLLTQLFGYIS